MVKSELLGGDRDRGACRDDHKLARLEREHLEVESQAASSEKDPIIAVLSHELRSHLAAIQAGVELLQRLPAAMGEPRALHALRVIERNVRLQAQFVNDLLTPSRLVRGQLTAERAPVQLGDSVPSAAEPCHADPARMELPMCDAPTARAAQAVSASGRTRLKVLLVEDNSDIRDMLSEALSYVDYTVMATESAEAALELLGREPVDVILSDIGLPGMDGYDFLRLARRLPSAAHIPALALTGYGQESDIRRAREAGYADLFVKPANIAAIDQQLRALAAHA